MRERIKWRNWSWLPASIAAGLWTTLAFWDDFDPITGCGTMGSLAWIFCNTILVGIAFFLFPRKGWRVLSPFLLFFFLLAGCPARSKAGLKLKLANESGSSITVNVARTDSPNRRMDFQVLANTSTVYRTAPGDYPESIELKIETADHQLKATIGQLRTNWVVYDAAGFHLRAVSNH